MAAFDTISVIILRRLPNLAVHPTGVSLRSTPAGDFYVGRMEDETTPRKLG